MKKINVLLLLIVLVGCGQKKGEEVEKKIAQPAPIASISFDTKILDMGSVTEGDTLVAKFNFVNNSRNDLLIEYVNPDCICTTFTLSDKKLRPGKNGLITLVLDTHGKRGPQRIYAVVKANTKSKFHRLLMKVNVN